MRRRSRSASLAVRSGGYGQRLVRRHGQSRSKRQGSQLGRAVSGAFTKRRDGNFALADLCKEGGEMAAGREYRDTQNAWQAAKRRAGDCALRWLHYGKRGRPGLTAGQDGGHGDQLAAQNDRAAERQSFPDNVLPVRRGSGTVCIRMQNKIRLDRHVHSMIR